MPLELSVAEFIEKNDWSKTQVIMGNGRDRNDWAFSRKSAVVLAINHAAVETPCDFAISTEEHLSKNFESWSLYQPYVVIREKDIQDYDLTPGGTISLLSSLVIPRAWRTCFTGVPMDDRPEGHYAYQIDALNGLFCEHKDKRIIQTTGNPSLLIPMVDRNDPMFVKRGE